MGAIGFVKGYPLYKPPQNPWIALVEPSQDPYIPIFQGNRVPTVACGRRGDQVPRDRAAQGLLPHVRVI